MTITSRLSKRTLKLDNDMDVSVAVIITSGYEDLSISVKIEDLVLELSNANIPGLTVTYTAPVRVPTAIDSMIRTRTGIRLVRTEMGWETVGNKHLYRDEDMQVYLRNGATIIYEPEEA